MTIIEFHKLIEIIKSHPEYGNWHKGVDADTALYISFVGDSRWVKPRAFLRL